MKCKNCGQEVKVMIFRQKDGTCSVNCEKEWEAKNERRQEEGKARRTTRPRRT